MSNMSYCRFENTLNDLRDCEEPIEDNNEELSDTEVEARVRLIEVCKRIANMFEGDTNG